MNKKMLIKSLTGIAIIAVVLPPLILGGIYRDILVAVFLAVASYEIASVSDQKPHYLLTAACFAATYALKLVTPDVFAGVVGLWLVILFAMELFFEKMTSDQVVYTFSLTVLFSLAMRGMDRIYAQPQAFLILLFVAFTCFICDTMAYFTGVFFGKHKMIPRVSPNKTWEGAIGGYLFAAVISCIYGLAVLKNLPSGLIITGSLILPAVAQIGDLSFSSVKRHFDIKDFGNLLPGHGGVLDRIDSLLFCLVIFNYLMALWRIV